jgi:hypothetical protein
MSSQMSHDDPARAWRRPRCSRRVIFGPDGKAITPRHTRRRGRLHRFYRTATRLKFCYGECPIRAVPPGEVEAAVINNVRALLRAPEIVVRVGRAAQLDGSAITVFVALALRRRGGRKVIVAPPGSGDWASPRRSRARW